MSEKLDGHRRDHEALNNDAMGDDHSYILDFNSPTANMFGCEPCPKCGSKYRFQLAAKPEFIQCDDCGFEQRAAQEQEKKTK
jgi:hypothetical protein